MRLSSTAAVTAHPLDLPSCMQFLNLHAFPASWISTKPSLITWGSTCQRPSSLIPGESIKQDIEDNHDSDGVAVVDDDIFVGSGGDKILLTVAL